jgi:RimJ/RimL family protein N-acetyltransferase
MRRILWNRNQEVMQFVAALTGEPRYDDYSTIGLVKDGEIAAGVVYQGHNGPNVLMHFALGQSPHVMTAAFICAAFVYPFQVLRCNRVTGLVRLDNPAAQQLDENLGFVREGVLRQGAADGSDLILYGMLKNECRFLAGRYLHALDREMALSGSHWAGASASA